MLWLFSIDDDPQKEQAQISTLSKVHPGNTQMDIAPMATLHLWLFLVAYLQVGEDVVELKSLRSLFEG